MATMFRTLKMLLSLALFFVPCTSCHSLPDICAGKTVEFSKTGFLAQCRKKNLRLRWVIFKDYRLNGEWAGTMTSAEEGFRFEPPEGSILLAEEDFLKSKKPLPFEKEKAVIGRALLFYLWLPMVYQKKSNYEHICQAFLNKIGRPQDLKEGKLFLGLRLGDYLVSWKPFDATLSPEGDSLQWPILLPFFNEGETKYSKEDLLFLFPGSKVFLKKEEPGE